MTDSAAQTEPRHDRVVERHNGLVARTALVSVLTLCSRILGFVREVISAMLFGESSAVFDAFLTAWRIPNLFRRFFGEGALSTSLQTALTAEDEEHGDEAGRGLFRATLSLTARILIGVTILAAIGLLIADRFAHLGFLGEPVGATAVIELGLELLPFVPLVCLAALCAGALQVRGHYLTPALAPVVMNTVWIATLVVLWVVAREQPALTQVRWLAMGVLTAGVAQLGIQVLALRRHGLALRGATRWVDEDGRESGRRPIHVLRQAAPLALGAAVYQINVMIDGLMAESLLRDGGPTAHYYANRIQQFPLALIAIAATAAVFPKLKALGQVGRREELRDLHGNTQLAVAFFALPASAGLVALSPWIARALFEHGAYGPDGTARIAAALTGLALALLPAGAVGLLSRVYYSLDDFRTPVMVSVAMLVANTLLNLAFVAGLGLDVEGLAYATMLSSWGNLLLLYPGLYTKLGLPRKASSDAASRIVRIGIAAIASGAAAWWITRSVDASLVELEPSARAAFGLVPGITAGVLVFAIFARVLRLPEWYALRARIARRVDRRSS